MPANDLKGLIAWLRANPDKTTLGLGGTGGPPHIAGVFFQKETGTRFQFVPLYVETCTANKHIC
jgi:tripartite-type tricarboxylate transporter receptor subunit TctC